MRRLTLSPLLLLLLASCGEPPPPATPTVPLAPAPTAPAAPPLDPALVHVSAVPAPASVSVDGELAEWGALDRAGAGSSLAFALTGDALLIAADLSEAARDGIWLSVSAPAPAVPLIGLRGFPGNAVTPYDCKFEQVWSEGAHDTTTKLLAPEAASACRAKVAKYDAFVAQLKSRFVRRFKIDREGVRSVKEGTAGLESIAGAKATWKPGPRGATVEVSLPLLALPRLREAPVTVLGVAAAPATSAPPEPVADGAMQKLPAPVSFEPHGELRARVFKAVNGRNGSYGVDFYEKSVGLSYHPGDPLHVESLPLGIPDADTIVPTEDLIYEKKAALGDVEVASARAFLSYLAIYRKGRLVELLDADPNCADKGEDREACRDASVRAVITRNGEIHVLSYHKTSLGWSTGLAYQRPGGWFILAIAPDGTHRTLTPEAPRPVITLKPEYHFEGPETPAYGQGVEYASAAFDRFGWRGDRESETRGKRTGLEADYRWDEAKKVYTLAWRRFPLPPEKKKAGAKKK